MGWVLQAHYDFKEHAISSQLLFEGYPQKKVIFTIAAQRHHYKIKTTELEKLCQKQGIALEHAKHRFVSFDQISPIDLSDIKEQIEQFYRLHYNGIQIQTLQVRPRVFTPKLPKKYTLHIPAKSYRHDHGTVYISADKQRIFFDYSLKATLNVKVFRHAKSRGSEISALDFENKTVNVTRLRREPLLEFKALQYRLKKKRSKGMILSVDDVEPVPLVRRHQSVQVELRSGGVLIEFSAIAGKDGGLFDIIPIQKADGKRLRAKVIGKNRVEMQ